MISYTPPGPTGEAFIKDDSFISGLMGPVGSGKSSAAIFKLFYKGLTQTPYERVRYSRWTCIRNTYGELESTTIRTFKDWFGEDIAPMKMGSSPIEAKMDFWLPDKTRVKMEWWFLALNRPDDLGKMRSLETTGIWINEASEVGKAIADKATERVGRYPKMAWGGADWAGVVMDTNPPDDDHWFYEMYENPNKDEHAMVMENLRSRGVLRKDQPYQRIFKQPGGLTLEGGAWRENPNAENITNLRGGFGYYWQQFPNKTDNWRKVFLGGNYGSVAFGKPVYPEYNDDLHCKEIKPYQDRPLVLGFDYGLTPACVIVQTSPRGQVRVLDELYAEGMGIETFAKEILLPHLAQNFAGMEIRAVGDPNGNTKSDSKETSCFQTLAENGVYVMPAGITNNLISRREAVAKCLNALTDGQPVFTLHPRCKRLRKGFNGSYRFERVQIMSEERYKDLPVKNEYSHLHDALQYACLHIKQFDTANWSGDKSRVMYPKLSIA